MTTIPTCSTCRVEMSKIGHLNSGNAKYVNYRCPTCHVEKSICLGLGN